MTGPKYVYQCVTKAGRKAEAKIFEAMENGASAAEIRKLQKELFKPDADGVCFREYHRQYRYKG
jgi:hypothetical protein